MSFIDNEPSLGDDSCHQTGKAVTGLLLSDLECRLIRGKDDEVPWADIVRGATQLITALPPKQQVALGKYSYELGQDPAWELARKFHRRYPERTELPTAPPLEVFVKVLQPE